MSSPLKSLGAPWPFCALDSVSGECYGRDGMTRSFLVSPTHHSPTWTALAQRDGAAPVAIRPLLETGAPVAVTAAESASIQTWGRTLPGWEAKPLAFSYVLR